MTEGLLGRLVRAWLVTAVTDAVFSSVLVSFFYGSTVARLWQGVASTLLGPSAMSGGTRTELIGLVMHFGVALAWTTVFLILYTRSEWIRNETSTLGGALKVASVYGPCIWLVMSFVVIQSLTHRAPTINFRWWVQFVGHIPFVAVPIVTSIARPVRARALRLAEQ